MLAGREGVLHPIACAEVIWRPSVAAYVVAHRHALAADTAEHQALHERGPFPRRALSAVEAVSLRTVPQPPLVVLVLRPGDVPLMDIRDERVPLLPGELRVRAAAFGAFALARPAEDERAGIARVVQDPERSGVRQLAPQQFAFPWPRVQA